MGTKKDKAKPTAAWTSPISGASMAAAETPVSGEQLAAKLGVSDRSVRVWSSMGLPIHDRGAHAGGSRYLESAARGWLNQNSLAYQERQAGESMGGHGGVRPGAGRPPGVPNRTTPAPDAPAEGPTFIEARRRSAVARAEREEMELARLRQELVPVAEVDEVFADTLIQLVRELEALPHRAAMGVLAANQLHPDALHPTEQIIESFVNEMRDRLEEAFGEWDGAEKADDPPAA